MPTSCRWRPSLLATACLVPCLWRLDPVPFRALLVPPRWWREGRVRHDLESFEALESKSELELLAQLAVLLMPEEPIEELFRSFKAPPEWRHEELLPDLATYGVLKDPKAALFVEYDGHPGHARAKGDRRDRRKNLALLNLVPSGSVVVRIGHAKRRDFGPQVLYIQVPTWQGDEDQSLTQILSRIVNELLSLRGTLAPDTSLRLMRHVMENRLSSQATSFAERRHVDGLLRFGAIQEDEEVKEKRLTTLQKLYKSWGT